ncbi:Beta-L-arabinofuranosidase, GH127 [Chitinophaga sp. CF118]|uniref:beta-L-arabinofuranosidase domain-containing protein n=1 Tax=Chitinophaga sp. CF118 TaxID=1884367 RepID=UPI0008E6D4CF|nr:beta-L-arabinofuranosidase domain-containing protein [Chitinophaga sp. CF118]SFD26553.1 Beta-L-arabinofuranosidase, GH127 [Chitinophaga sp. CF118]
MKRTFLSSTLLFFVASVSLHAQKAEVLQHTANTGSNSFYLVNRAPLQKEYFTKLPITSVTPKGWVRKALEMQRDGLTGNLGEISIWLSKTDNAWLNKKGKGKYGWEELPYWLKGYANIGYVLQNDHMIKEAKFWLNAVLNNQRNNGDFGPNVEKGEGKRDLWTNMPMLWCLQSYYEYSKDPRVIKLMTKYFKWQLSIPDDKFLEDYWENSRGGDNMYSVYWLYNHTGDKFLLDLATKIDKNTANWRQPNNLPNWHNVNVAECFREPAQYYQQSGNLIDINATYNNFKIIRNKYGQVPGGMFGADENAREGYDDPRQAVETCGLVEQITSDNMLLGITGDPFWADNAEDVAFNIFSAAFTPDYRALRYLTAPNMVVSDSKNHSPGIANEGPFLMMNPFSSRCCQHNHSAGWVYYSEYSWMATPDNGIAAQLYFENEVQAKVGNGTVVTLSQQTKYPFDDQVELTLSTPKTVSFPLYLRIPSWCKNPALKINGKVIALVSNTNGYIKISNTWKNGDKISLQLPMELTVRKWERNKNSVSVNYGPLTYSLLIQENYIQQDSKATAIGDSRWQEGADPRKWPSFEIKAGSDWNYGLLINEKDPASSFKVIRKSWPAGNDPFTNATAPIIIKAQGKKITGWGIDQYGLAAVLPQSPVNTTEPATELTLIPMGGARLRISSFPVVE